MTTALDLIKTGLAYLGEYDPGETLSSADSSEGLASLNSMLEAMAIDRLLVFQIVQGSHSWGASVASKTIGPASTSADLTAARPDRIESAFIRDSSDYDYPLTILRQREQFDGITDRSVTSTIPTELFYYPANPKGTLYLYPVPSEAITLLLNTWQILQSFAATTTDLALPPGYRELIETNLPFRLAAKFGGEVQASVALLARESVARIKRLNAPVGVLKLEPGVTGAGRTNILTGT